MTSRASAIRYARALFDVALAERQDLAQVDRELSGLAAMVAGNEDLQRALSHPAIPAARKRAVVEQLLSLSPVNPILSRVLLLLADRDRLVLIPELAEAYRSRLMDHQQVVRAHVTTAVALPDDRVAALQQGWPPRPAARCSSRWMSIPPSSAAPSPGLAARCTTAASRRSSRS